MKVLIIGGGGREHALAWKVAQAEQVEKVLVAPGNAGTARDAKLENVTVDVNDQAALAELAERERESADALALAQAPDIVRGLRELVLMAGAHFNGGNITPTAEFNVFADPHAAEIVLGSGVPITMLPLDLTHKVLATPERIARLRGLGNQAGRIVADILDAYVRHDMQYYGLPGGPVHDATVVGYLLQPSLFGGRWVNMAIDSREGLGFGQTVVDWYGGLKKPANVRWITEGDAQGFFDLLTQGIGRLP